MSSPFSKKFLSKSPISPLGKALVGKQNRLPQHLQDAIKAAPEMKESPLDKHGEKYRNEAKKLSEDAEQGDYDYDNKKVTDLLDKAKAADARHAAEKEAKAQKTKVDSTEMAKKDPAQSVKKKSVVNYGTPLNFDIYGADAEFGGGDFYVSNAADFQRLQDNIVSATKDAMSNKEIKGEYQKKRAEKRKGRKGGEANQSQKFKDKTKKIKDRGQANIDKAKSGADKSCVGKPSGYIFTTVASDGSMSTTTCP